MMEGSFLPRPLMLAGRAVRLREGGDLPKKRKIKPLRTTLSSPCIQVQNPLIPAQFPANPPDSDLNRRDMWTNTTVESVLDLHSRMFSYSLLSPTQSFQSGRKFPQLLLLPIKTMPFLRTFATYRKSPLELKQGRKPGTLSSRGKLKRLLSSPASDLMKSFPQIQVSPSLLAHKSR